MSSMLRLRAWTPCGRASTIRDAHRKTRVGTRATIPKPCAKLKCPNWRAARLWIWSRIPRWATSRPRSRGRKWCRFGGCNCSTNPWANPKASASPTSAGIKTATIGARGKRAASFSPRGWPSATLPPIPGRCALCPGRTAGGFWTLPWAFNSKTSTLCAGASPFPNAKPGAKFRC